MIDYKREFWRFLPLCLLAVVGLWGDLPSFKVLFYAIGITVTGAYLSHITRRILFPYIDLSVAWDKANDTELGAALCFLGVCLLLAVFILSFVMLLR